MIKSVGPAPENLGFYKVSLVEETERAVFYKVKHLYAEETGTEYRNLVARRIHKVVSNGEMTVWIAVMQKPTQK